MPKLFPKPLPVAMIPAPVPTANRFEPLAEVAVENKNTIETKSDFKAEQKLFDLLRARVPAEREKEVEKSTTFKLGGDVGSKDC